MFIYYWNTNTDNQLLFTIDDITSTKMHFEHIFVHLLLTREYKSSDTCHIRQHHINIEASSIYLCSCIVERWTSAITHFSYQNISHQHRAIPITRVAKYYREMNIRHHICVTLEKITSKLKHFDQICAHVLCRHEHQPPYGFHMNPNRIDIGKSRLYLSSCIIEKWEYQLQYFHIKQHHINTVLFWAYLSSFIIETRTFTVEHCSHERISHQHRSTSSILAFIYYWNMNIYCQTLCTRKTIRSTQMHVDQTCVHVLFRHENARSHTFHMKLYDSNRDTFPR